MLPDLSSCNIFSGPFVIFFLFLTTAFKKTSAEEAAKLKAVAEDAQKTSTQLQAGVEPILDEFFPESVGVHGQDSAKAIELLQLVPKKMKSLIFESANSVCRHALAMIRSFYPSITLELIEAGFASGTTAERALQLLDETDSLSKAIVKDVLEPDSEKSDDKQD